MDNHNLELLNAIYKNVTMATHAIDSLQDKIADQKLLKLMNKQNKIYETITAECEDLSGHISEDLKAINPIAKMTSSVSINLKTMMNDQTSHIAEMLIQGSTMGITEIIKAIGEYPSAHKEIKDVAIKLQHSEEEFVDSLKTFLVKKQ